MCGMCVLYVFMYVCGICVVCVCCMCLYVWCVLYVCVYVHLDIKPSLCGSSPPLTPDLILQLGQLLWGSTYLVNGIENELQRFRILEHGFGHSSHVE